MSDSFDVSVRGGGVVGHVTALLLARERLRVALHSAVTARPAVSDVRAYALNAASRDLLLGLRCWPAPPAVTAVKHMQVMGDAGGEINFSADQLAVPALAWIVDVAALESTLAQGLAFAPQISRVNTPASARLDVVCEGRTSQTRDELGVEFNALPYGQHALATRVRAPAGHGGVARQWFRDGEVLALLPCGGDDSDELAVVWSLNGERAHLYARQEEASFEAALQQATDGRCGQLKLITERHCWPLQQAMAERWCGREASHTWVLAGDAAHSVHPLAGQGLNLGLGDAAALANALQQREYWRDITDLRVLRRYERQRKAAVLPLARGMDGLQRLFDHPAAGISRLRNAGLNGVERAGWLKRWAATQAMGPGHKPA